MGLLGIELTNPNGRSRPGRYVLAVLAPAVIAGLMQLSWPFFHANPAMLYLLAVVLSSWYGGLGPGIVSVFTACLLTHLFFMPPYYSLRLTGHDNYVRLMVLILVGTFISIMSELMHRQRRHAERSLAEATHAEGALRELQARTESVLASVADIHMVFDRDWRYTYINDAAVHAINRPSEQILGNTLWELYPDIIGSELERQYRRAMDQRVPVAFDYYYSTNDTWWENRFYPSPEGVAVFATNISDRKRAEEARRVSEERYRSLFENARDAVYVHDLNGIYLSVNRSAEMLSGYSREEIVGKHFREFIPADQFETVRRNLFRKLVIQGGTTYEVEVKTRDGRLVPVEVSSNLIYQKGIPVGVQGMARDITERRRAEAAVRQAQLKYREIVENAEEGIFQTTPDGVFLTANPALARMFGFSSAAELINARIDIAHQHYVEPQRRLEFIRELERQGAVNGFEYRAWRKDGSKVWVSNNVRAVFDENGQIAYYEGTAVDITKRKRIENALRDSEQRFRAAFEQGAASMAVIDAKGRFLQVNAALCEYLGFSETELLNLNLLDLTHPKDRLAANHRIVRLKTDLRSTINNENRYLRKDGAVLWGHTKIVSLLGQDSLPDYSIVVIQDITERKLAHEAAEEFSRRLLEAQEQERQTIARELHDEIGQVLTAVRMGLDSLMHGLKDAAASQRLQENIAIVDDALDKVRDLSLNLRPSLLDDLGLQSALRWYSKRYIKQTGIEASLTIAGFEEDERLPRILETASYRVVQEALTNVARHAQASRAAVSLWRTEGCLMLSIKDNGVGFDVPRRRSLNTTLGLQGMQERAEAAGGILEINSTPREGTEVLLILPLVNPAGNGQESSLA